MHRRKRCNRAYFGTAMHLYLLSFTTVSILAHVFRRWLPRDFTTFPISFVFGVFWSHLGDQLLQLRSVFLSRL